MRFETLRDGTHVLVRQPDMGDVERMTRFFRELPEEDHRYLRVHEISRERTEQRIREGLEGRVYRLVALLDDRMVADGALEFSGGWGAHTAEVRVFVHPEFRRRRLGAILIADLFREAQKRGVQKVIARMAAPQLAARRVFERLGFHVDAVLPGYVRDARGEIVDQVVMSCTLDEAWRELKDFYDSDHWPDG